MVTKDTLEIFTSRSSLERWSMTDIIVGDWVRFHRNGCLYIGVVEYIKLGDSYPYKKELIVSCGTLYEDEVLEVRRLVYGVRT